MYRTFLLALMIYLPREVEQVYPRPASASKNSRGVLRYYVASGFELSKTVTLLDASTFCEEGLQLNAWQQVLTL